MTIRFQRLLIILISLILISGSAILILSNYKKNIVFFYTPSELFSANLELSNNIRIGGYVKDGSVKMISSKNNHISFIITDNKYDVLVEFQGILPDIFREKQGAVVEGELVKKNKVKAKKVFAKHDENYMPATIKKQLEKSDYWNQNYSSKDLSYEKIPKFQTETLFNKNFILSNNDLENKIVLINFFASWCLPCKKEHALLMNLKEDSPELLIIGFNHKDKKEDAIEFLNINGNPYSFVGIDKEGEIGLEFGVFGLPETFLTDNKGHIIYKHSGPLSNKVIQKEILPNL